MEKNFLNKKGNLQKINLFWISTDKLDFEIQKFLVHNHTVSMPKG